jgi:hypothetical protein
VFGGAKRKASEEWGLVVFLCGNECHRNGENAVHKNAEIDRALKKLVQQRAMQHYGWDEQKFIEIFGKNYL